MWRDTRSLALGQEMFPTADSRLVPDAAFALGRVHGPEDAPGGQLCLAREDREAGALAAARPADVAHGDWKLSPLRRAAYTPLWRGSHGLTAIEASGRQVPEAVWSAVYATVAQNNFACATRLLANRSAVVTDRLHGHILCTLLRVPHVLVDDRYGKTSSFYQTWTAEDPLSVLVPAHEAFAAAGRLTARITATADA
jgi:exopolysaccharide biosynthesis predicted pyruvyltransferase EpsI